MIPTPRASSSQANPTRPSSPPPSYPDEATIPNATLSSAQTGNASSSVGQVYEGPQPRMPANLPFGAGTPPSEQIPPPPYQSPHLGMQNPPRTPNEPFDLDGSYVLPQVQRDNEERDENRVNPSRGQPTHLDGSYVLLNRQNQPREEDDGNWVQHGSYFLRMPTLPPTPARSTDRPGVQFVFPTIDNQPPHERLPTDPQPNRLTDAPPTQDEDPREPAPLEDRVSTLEFGKKVMTGGTVFSLAGLVISSLSKRGSHPSLRLAALGAFAAFGTGYFAFQNLSREVHTPPNTPVQAHTDQPSETFIRLVTTLQGLQHRVNLLLTRNTNLQEEVEQLQGEVARLSRPPSPIASSSSTRPQVTANPSLDQSIRAIQRRFQEINDTVRNLRERLPLLQDTMTILETSFHDEYQIEETLNQLTSNPLPASQSVLTLTEGDEEILQRLGLLDTIQRELTEFATLIDTISTADEEVNRQLDMLRAQLSRR